MKTSGVRRANETLDADELLTRAFRLADEARAQGDHPFGALLAVDGAIVAEARNRVNTDRDVTAHAETMLVRIAERAGLLPQMASGVVYTSCEPCPMWPIQRAAGGSVLRIERRAQRFQGRRRRDHLGAIHRLRRPPS